MRILLLTLLTLTVCYGQQPAKLTAYAQTLVIQPLGTVVIALASGCEDCTHYWLEVEVQTASGSETLRKLVKRDTAPGTYAYWLVDGEPPAVRVWRVTAAAIKETVTENYGLKQ
jgi:hypothetical protein